MSVKLTYWTCRRGTSGCPIKAEPRLKPITPAADRAISHQPRRALILNVMALIAPLLLVGLTTEPAYAGADYVLGVQDKVRVKVVEWRASLDEVFEWVALNNEYTIGKSGRVSLPLVGEIPAAGLSTSDLAKTIGQRLRARIGLVGMPDVSVELVQYRPFYILGQVERPGEYPFRPELTVLRAVSIAGGMKRATELSLTRSITAMGEIQLHALEMNSLLARRARLQAELKGVDEISFPRPLLEQADIASIALLMQQEQLILKARREALDTQLQAYEELKAYLRGEVQSLEAQIKTLDKQADLFKQEHDNVSSLVSRGLAVASRQLELERAMASMEGDRLRLETNLMKAQQDISRTDIATLDLKNKRATEVTLELRQTQAKMEETAQKSETAERLLREAEVSTARLFSRGRHESQALPAYTIVRQTGDETRSIVATETTLVVPGDTIKVEFPEESGTLPGVPPESSAVQGSSVRGGHRTATASRATSE